MNGLYNSEINEKRCIGFCSFHRSGITVTQLRQKECLKKQCRHFEKREHEFWRQREITKQRRKERKARIFGI